MPDIQKWKFLDACSPFIEDDKHYIVIDSEYATPGDDPETRYAESLNPGVLKLLEFYGKDISELDEILKASSVEDKYIFTDGNNLVPMKVLVSVTKTEFDLVQDDPSICAIDVPEQKIVVEYPVREFDKKIQLVVSGMKELLPALAASDVFITNINVENELLNLKNTALEFVNYFQINNVQPTRVNAPDCSLPTEEDRILTLGFDTNYKIRYVLIDNEQYTIGYNCLIDVDALSHITTSHYLTRLDEMIVDLKNRESDDFNFLNFLIKHTLPVPIIEAKDNPNDGVDEYDENGNFSPPQPTPSGPSCKTNQQLAQESQTINAPVTKLQQAAIARTEQDYVGPEETSPAAIEATIREVTGMSDNSSPNTEPENNDLLSKQQVLQNNEQGSSLYQNIDFTLNDVVAKVDLGLMLQQSIPTMLTDLIMNYGEEMYEDPDLQHCFQLQDEQKGVTNAQEKFGSFAIKAGGPVLQEMNLPPFFPNSKDFLKPAMDQLKISLGNLLLQALISIIIETFQDFTDFNLSNPNQIKSLAQNTEYKTWLSETAGISLDDINNPDNFASLLALRGGKGFSGIISNILSKKDGTSRLELCGFILSDTPIPDGLPITIADIENPGKLKQKYLKQADLVQITGEISTGVDELSAVLKPDEFQSLLKGKPSKNVLNLSTKVLTRNVNGCVFKNKQDVLDVMSGIGKILNPSLLTSQTAISSVANNPDLLNSGPLSSLRAQMLGTMDPTMSQTEIDSIIEEEKQRKKQRVLKTCNKLKNYEEGTLLPIFPDIFGSNGLIQDVPPIIKEVSENTSKAVIDPIMETFYGDVAPTVGTGSYINWWNQSLARQYPDAYLYNIPSRIFSDFSLEAKSDEYLFGYTPLFVSTTTIPTRTLAGSTTYDFGKLFGGYDAVIDKPDRQNLFDQMKSTFNITDSYFDWYDTSIAPFVKENDTGLGDAIAIATWTDSPAGSNVMWEAEVNESEGKVTIRLYALDPAQQIDARPAGFSDDIVALNLRSDISYQKVQYKSDVYKIGDTLASLGDKDTTGELATRSFNSGFDIDNISDIDFTNLKASSLGGVGLFGSKINSTSVNSSIITQFVDYVNGQKYSSATLDETTEPPTTSSDFDKLDLSLDNDIFDVEGLKADSVNTMNFLLNGSLTGEYCDSLSEIRRNTLNISLRLLVRAFIIEQALISIQVFNGFDLAFMDNQIFANSVYSLLKKEISKYQQSFDTLESSLLVDIKEAALKYYEIMNLSGQSEETPSSGKDAVRQMILDEAKILKEPITFGLNLKWNATTWNGFLTKVIFGEYDDINDLVSQTDNIMQYGGSTYVFVKERKGSLVYDGSYTYSYNLVYVEKQSILSQIDNWTSDYIITDEDGDPTGWEGTTILSVECTREDAADDEDEVYDSLAKLMFETDEYNKVFNDISPVKVFISCLSLYQVSALSDPATFRYFGAPEDDGVTFKVPYIGADLNDFMAKTKLTILQLFASSIYGGGKIDYQDPFLQKAQP
ncbi:hypothetical protein [uncultured Mediterranean phage]|nr:hypothetical protein [uncultured Mediterranean phage]